MIALVSDLGESNFLLEQLQNIFVSIDVFTGFQRDVQLLSDVRLIIVEKLSDFLFILLT